MPALDDLRKEIERIDDELIRKLAERAALSKKMALIKRETGHGVCDPLQEQKQLKRYALLAESSQLDIDFIGDVFNLIMTYSKKLQAR